MVNVEAIHAPVSSAKCKKALNSLVVEVDVLALLHCSLHHVC